MPGCRLTFSPITSIIYSLNSYPLRPVLLSFPTRRSSDLINVPPLPSEMPCRISQVAPVTLVFSRLSEKTDRKSKRLNSSYSYTSYAAYCLLQREVLSSLASPLTPLKSPLYQSGPDVPGVHVGDPVGVAVAVGVRVRVGGPPVVPSTPNEQSLRLPSSPDDVKLAPKKLLSKNAFWWSPH